MVDASEVWRDYNTDAVPSSGDRKVPKSQVREWGLDIERHVLNRTVSQKSGAYTVQNSDKGKTLELTGDYYAVTFAAVGSYDTTFATMLVNTSATRAKRIILNGDGKVYRLYPKQIALVFKIGSAWYIQKPERYRKPTAELVFRVGAAGSDDNDGLASGAGNELLTGQAAIDRILGDIESSSGLTNAGCVVQFEDGTYNEPLHIGGMPAAPVNHQFLTLRGNLSDPLAVVIASPTNNLPCVIGGNCLVKCESFSVNGSGGTNRDGIRATNGGQFILEAMNFQDCNTGSHIRVLGRGSWVVASGDYTIQGGAAAHWWVDGPAEIETTNPTEALFLGNSAFVTAFAVATDGGVCLAPGFTYDLGGKSVTGPRYLAGRNGVINTNSGASATALPGNSAGSTSAGGQYN